MDVKGYCEGHIATTNTDSLGHKLTKEELIRFEKQIDKNPFINYEHDISKHPIGKIIKHKIVKLDNGEYAIWAMQEVYDEEILKKIQTGEIKGCSYEAEVIKSQNIKQTKINTLIMSMKDESKEKIKLLIKKDEYSKENISLMIESLEQRFDVTPKEVLRKSVDPVTILTIVFIIGARKVIEESFLDLYKVAKDFASRLVKTKRGDKPTLHLKFIIKETIVNLFIKNSNEKLCLEAFEKSKKQNIESILQMDFDEITTKIKEATINYENGGWKLSWYRTKDDDIKTS